MHRGRIYYRPELRPDLHILRFHTCYKFIPQVSEYAHGEIPLYVTFAVAFSAFFGFYPFLLIHLFLETNREGGYFPRGLKVRTLR